MIFLQEPFFKKENIFYNAFRFYQYSKLKKRIKDFRWIKNKLSQHIVMNDKRDLLDYLYFSISYIWHIHKISQKVKIRTERISKYDNPVERRFAQNRVGSQKRTILKKMWSEEVI